MCWYSYGTQIKSKHDYIDPSLQMLEEEPSPQYPIVILLKGQDQADEEHLGNEYNRSVHRQWV